jgi:hypothetical protein
VTSRRWRRAILVAVGLAIIATLATFLARRRAPSRGPVLVVRAIPSGTIPKEAPPDTGADDRAMALAVASTSPESRKKILEAMSYATARLEARLSPLVTDLGDDDGDPVQQFRHSMAAYVPSFTAAREIERGSWRSADLAVRVARGCDEANVLPGEVCFSLWDTNDGPPDVARKARFLAWAASRAAVVDLGTRDRAIACAAALRARIGEEPSTVALVLTRDDLQLRPLDDRSEVQDAARKLGRAMAANDVEDTQHLEAFARAAPEGQVATWLDLPTSGLVVVPRLSAIGDTAGLVSEIEAAAAAQEPKTHDEATLRWVHRP